MDTIFFSSQPLIIWHFDDNPYDLSALKKALEHSVLKQKFVVRSFSSSEAFRKVLGSGEQPEIIILDIHEANNSEDNGFKLASTSRQHYPKSTIIMRSSLDDGQSVITCLRAGADDFISKKTGTGELPLRILNSYELSRLKQGTKTSLTPTIESHSFAGSTIQQIASRIPNIIKSAVSTVHISGETGTGKEVVADLFSQGASLLKVNCGAIAANLLESELFGYVKGAFTGATGDKKGLLEQATGGWIFLDEVATLSPSAQVALLRVIENQEIRPVGAAKTHKINVRVLSATNENIPDLVAQGKFRADLWQRLSEIVIHLPPLRDRPNDIKPIIEYFCRNMHGGPYLISEAALEVLCALPWQKGNIRQLRNCLRAMTEYSSEKTLTPISIPRDIWAEVEAHPTSLHDDLNTSASKNTDHYQFQIQLPKERPFIFEEKMDEIFAQLLHRIFADSPRLSLRSLAQRVGVPRTTLSEWLKRLVHRELIHKDELAKMFGQG